jgi:hypothetical protein
VEIMRSGVRYTVYLKAPQLYRKHAGGYDVVMDESTTLKTTSKSSKGGGLVSVIVPSRFYRYCRMNLDESHHRQIRLSFARTEIFTNLRLREPYIN